MDSIVTMTSTNRNCLYRRDLDAELVKTEMRRMTLLTDHAVTFSPLESSHRIESYLGLVNQITSSLDPGPDASHPSHLHLESEHHSPTRPPDALVP